MKRYVLLLFTLVLCIFGAGAVGLPGSHNKNTDPAQQEHELKWAIDPFDGKLFIENLGQFDTLVYSNEKVLFGVQCADGLKMFFTSSRVIYQYQYIDVDKSTALGHDHDPDNDRDTLNKPKTYSISAEWQAANNNTTLVADSLQTYYYAYSIGSATVKAKVYKKLTYKNLYPGIDVEYFFPAKGGIKYNVIVHAGADISALKLKYSGIHTLKLNAKGDAIVSTDFGNFTDHAPVSFYSDNHQSVGIHYKLNGVEEDFKSAAPLNLSRPLDIDPWQTDPFPATAPNDKVYDVDFDNNGNIYGFGSANPFKCIKLNSAGVIQWVYNATALVTTCYGDFAVDKVTGTAYLTEGYDGAGAKALKVNTLGVLKATWPGTTNLDELWRDEYDECNHQIICGAGGTSAFYQACTLDTTLATMTPQNVMGVAQAFHDVCMIAIDPTGKSCYMCSTSDAIDTGNANNFLFKMPIPGLTPTTMSARDGFHFLEDGTVNYIGAGTSFSNYGNGFNGLAASQNWLYLWNGARLERMNKITGAITAHTKITNLVDDGTQYYNTYSGGLDVDVCENVYVGYDSAIMIYNSALSKTGTIIMPTTNTYDIRLDTMHKAMYMGGCQVVTSSLLPASPAPVISKTTTPPTTCSSCNATATAELTYCGNPDTVNVTYLWSNGQTARTATGLCPGTYTVTISLPVGCNVQKYTDTVNVKNGTGAGGGLTITKTINDVACNGGPNNGSINFNVSGGTGPYTYTWTPAVGTNANATGLAVGTYTCDIKDVGCDTAIEIINITQPAPITLTASAFPVSCGAGCNGTATVIPAGGTGPYSYLWSNGQTTASISGLCAGTFSVVITDKNGCKKDTTPLTVSVASTIVVTTTVIPAKCMEPNGNVTITVTGGTPPYTYAWSSGATTSNLNNVLPGNYCLVVTDLTKCTDTTCVTITNLKGDTASITSVTNVSCNGGTNGIIVGKGSGGTAPYTYDWSNGEATATATGLAAGTYTFTLIDATGCKDTAVATVKQPAAIVPTPLTPPTICIGQSDSVFVNVTGGTPGYTYNWTSGCTTSACSVSPVVTTTYSVTITDANGCVSKPIAVVVDVNPPIKVTTAPQKDMCPGGSVNLSVNASGGDGIYTYLWTPAGSLSCNTCQNTTASPATTTIYTVTVSDGCGTKPVTDSTVVIIDPLPVVAFAPDTDVSGCSPLCVNFTDKTTVALGGIKSWSWTFGDGGTSVAQDPNHCYNNGGVYSVALTVVSDSGCYASLNLNNLITVYPHPVAAFTYNPQPVTIIAPTVTFINLSTDSSGIKSNFWQFNDGTDSTSFSINTVHTYPDTGTYCASLFVVDNHGCTDSINECIDVEPIYTLYIPNAFSPNSDGLNDIFLPKGVYICDFEMFIFDRWGQQLFHSTNIDNGWNGGVNNKGDMVQEDTYVYLINAVDCIKHSKHTYIGKVTVIR